MALDTRQTAFGATGAVAAWLAMVLLAIQVGYSFDFYWLLERDFEVLVVALAGLGITLLSIFWKSSASHQEKVMIGVVSLVAFCGCPMIGGLFVACSNGNCL